MNNIFDEIKSELLAISDELETEGYTDFEQPEVIGFIDEEFNSVWEGR